MAVTNVPIWRDTYAGLGSVASRSYVVKLGGGTIYAGTAYARPGESVPSVLINDIAAPYLSQSAACLSIGADDYFAADIIKTFQVYDTNNVQYGNDFACYLDCSRENINAPLDYRGAHAPINSRIAPGMPLIFTLYNSAALTYDGGGATWVRIRRSSQITADNVLAYSGAGNYHIDPPTYSASDTWVRMNGHQYDLVRGCHRYALYYVNAYGAWDFLLIEGAAQEGRRYERHTMKRIYSNSGWMNRGTWNYANGEVRTWTLHTGWIDETGAERMHHLVGSTLVYLLDLSADLFIPVVVTDTEVTVRRYEQEGKPVSYAITVEEGREGLRR